MKSKLENAGPCRKLLHVSAGAEETNTEYEEILSQYRAHARIPGFRKGKAPVNVVEKRFRKEIEEDVKDRLVPRLYRTAIEQEKANPIAVVDVHEVVFAKSAGISFDVTLDVAPDFKLPKYTRISLRRNKVAVDPAEVDKAIDRIRQSSAKYEDAVGRPIKDGDFVKCDFTGEIDGKSVSAVSEEASVIASGKDFSLLIGEADIIPGISKGLMGASIGDERQLDVEFPSEYRLESLRGKKAVYKVTVKGIRERVLPALDDEFAKKFDASSAQGLKDLIHKELLESAENNEKERLKGEIIQYLLGKVKMDVPLSIVEQEKAAMVRTIVNRIARQGASREQIESQRDSILDEAATTSSERVKTSYILSRISEEEKIAVDDSAVDNRIAEMAQRYGMPAEKLRAEMEKRNSLEGLRSEIKAEKTLEFLYENAKIK